MLTERIFQSPQYHMMLSAMKKKGWPAQMTGLGHIHKAAVIAGLGREFPLLVVTPDEAMATRLCEDINSFSGETQAHLYPAREFTFRDVESASREYEFARLRVLSGILSGQVKTVVCSIEALMQYTLPPKTLQENTLLLHPGEEHTLESLTARFLSAGYERRDQVDGVCQFSQRGGILDFYPPHAPAPYRVEFWGDEIDTVSVFDLDSQRRIDTVKEAAITPAREVLYKDAPWLLKRLGAAYDLLRGKQGVKAKEHLLSDMEKLEGGLTLQGVDKFLPLLYPQPGTLFDYLPDAALVFCELVSVKDASKTALWQHYEDVKLLLEEGILFKGCDTFTMEFSQVLSAMDGRACAILENFARTIPEVRLSELCNLNAVTVSPWGGDLKILQEDLDSYLRRDWQVIVLAGTDKAAAALRDDLAGRKIPLSLTEKDLTPGRVCVLEGVLSGGFEIPELKFALITHGRVTAKTVKRKKSKKPGEQIRSLSDIVTGDYVVHASHGIGVFEGVVKREIHGVTKDYLRIRYAGTDTLFVPVTQLDLVSKYIGPKEDKSVKLNKLNSVEWQKTRQRVKKAVTEMAEELIRLYAARMKAEGHAFSEDTDWQKDFEDRFPYEETDDQLRCIAEIKEDMQAPRPMDRLLCGDVGFGKTEVAIRAAFKCVMDGKQCAVLVPTTILAAQHFQTFQERMQGFPINIELMSRFRSPKQQEQTVKKLRRGEVDIVIGTHRLLQKDIQFKDLGLCIIDEEQRFGVAHKEKFKEMRKSVDVLTLSATPIPRTLNMAMSGIRDMSTIEEAPMDRHPVQTYVMEHDWGVLTEAIRRELRRGGQVFYLHNRVESIDSCAHRISQMVPEARVATAHGKMSEEQLSEMWRQLLDHEVDILVCTTIIETGVDVPNCNTLIIESADNMGLSQLYQIRGRVGRSTRRAFAYFTFFPGKELTDIASKRLSAIREFTSFGSGFRIAMRDLEIRGAGNVLGTSQHGHMEAVGYEMYLKLLSEAVSEQKGEAVVPQKECLVDIRIGAHIPEGYIDNLAQRIDIYKKIASIQNEEDAMDVTDELIDRFGDPPQSVQGLVDVALLRNIAAGLGIYEISQKNDLIVFYPSVFDFEKASRVSAALRSRVSLGAGAKPYIAVRVPAGEEPIHTMRTALYLMSSPEK